MTYSYVFMTGISIKKLPLYLSFLNVLQIKLKYINK